MKYFKLLIISTVLLSTDHLLAENCPTLDVGQARQLLDGGSVNGWTIKEFRLGGILYPAGKRPPFTVVKVSPPFKLGASVSTVHPLFRAPYSMYICSYNWTSAGENVSEVLISKPVQ